jgi:hypothetical protein
VATDSNSGLSAYRIRGLLYPAFYRTGKFLRTAEEPEKTNPIYRNKKRAGCPLFIEEDSLLGKHPLINPNFQNKTNLKDVF